jgi:hypothetical protein
VAGKGEEWCGGSERGWTSKSRSDFSRGGSGCGVARGPALRLAGEGVFEFPHPHLKVGEALLLLGQEEVFNPIKSRLHLGAPCGHILLDRFDVLLAGHGLMDERGQAFNGGAVVIRHMSSSIDEPRAVSMAGVGLRRSLLAPHMRRKLPMFASPTLTVCGPLHVVILPSNNSQWIPAKVLSHHAVWELV